MSEKVAEEVVKRDVKTIFDPATKELIRVIMPFMSKTEVMTLSVDRGWVAEASFEGVVLLPGVHRTMFRLDNQKAACEGLKISGKKVLTLKKHPPLESQRRG